ncbi:MAG TPA: peptidoglycan DD-metalloendopeptidase family protein, partial [Solirubrobacteraceae bacterium]|nr:peptidoglycan DD-metalloendopeptidase family protein [Solirubrobacteraceae bacterium]
MRTLPLVVLLVAPLVVSAGTARAGERGWAWPVRGPVAERFALSAADPYARGQHRGIDIAARAGAAVRAACAGRVRFAGAAGGFGRAVTVTCGPYAVTYGHLEAIATAAGERVDRGDRIGRVGKTGRGSTPGPHLHLGVRRAADPNGYVDPLALLPTTRPPSPPPTAPARRAPPPPAPRP